MPRIFLGISSIEANRCLTIAEFKQRTSKETGLPPSSYKIYRLKRISRDSQAPLSTDICAIIPSQATRLNVGLLNALSHPAAQPTSVSRANRVDVPLLAQSRAQAPRDNQSLNIITVVEEPPAESPAEGTPLDCVTARDVFALCDAFRLRYIIAKETHETVTRILESLKVQLEAATRGPKTDFEAGLIRTVRKSLVTSVGERKNALLVALETEIAEEERMELQFSAMAGLYR